MNARKLLLLPFFFLSLLAYSQTDDVSIIITPQVGYNWFDKKSTVENGTMYGIQAGFGFGKVMELRGVWERSWDLKQNFGKYEGDLQNLFPDFNFQDRSIKVSRIGGEFKTNLPVGGFSPYFILGTGVQKFETSLTSGEEYNNDNLYGSGGLGFKISLGDRTTLNLEGRGLVYNMNPGSMLYNEGGSSEFDEWVNNTDRSTMYNWSLMAGLQFYLGGRVEDEMDELDRAYLRRFSGGLSGTKVTLSPGAAFINFNDDAAYRNTYLLGGILGVDFSHFAGLQAYYYRSTENKEISLDFDELEMYGADFVGKLNVPRGIVPFITVGGGYLNTKDSYVGRPAFDQSGVVIGSRNAPSGYFAKGGAGLELPLSPYIQLFGGVNALLTVDDQDMDVTELRNTSQLQTHTMYNAGIRLNIGRSSNTGRVAERTFERRFDDERSEYDARISTLEAELKDAYDNNDTEKALAIMQEKKAVDSVQQVQSQPEGLIRLTPIELEQLIEKILEGVNEQAEEMTVEERLERIERLLMTSGQTQPSAVGIKAQESVVAETPQTPVDEKLIREINELRQELEAVRRDARRPSTPEAPIYTQPSAVAPGIRTVAADQVHHLQSGFAPYVGVNFGDAETFNVGLRRYFAFNNTRVMFAPEAYLAFGDGLGFGLSANGVYPFATRESGFSPYLGAGVGIHSLGNNFNFATNVLGGVAYKLGNGSLTLDYSIRGAFDNNQLAAGYRFRF